MDLISSCTFLSALLTVLFVNSVPVAQDILFAGYPAGITPTDTRTNPDMLFGVAIKCFDCNSVNNSMCLDPSLYDKETLQKYKLQRDCSSGNLGGHKEFFCRKMTQTILHHGLEAEVRVTRGCGWVRHHRECYKADNDDHLELVCQCFKDNCNSANVERLPIYSLLLSLVGMLGVSKVCLEYY